ncbi:unnamed protein product [Aspergillus oryzae RIB40]|uniref:DNA, SC009 n=1 Tax=Aspergillus oryzae (strain ATCC 42149 / RIB 40) TaxID=510516 RepID=Q2UV16_ASPOR|nr:unnamed protein product [Aspergillus oryzae RIB40]BAE54599.1 unnamed protein product [Aspergillus oryzae RIB40]
MEGDQLGYSLLQSLLCSSWPGVCAALITRHRGSAVSSAGEDQSLHKGIYGAGQWLPLILTVGILTGVSCIGALGFLREGKQERSVDNRSQQDHGDSCNEASYSRLLVQGG